MRIKTTNHRMTENPKHIAVYSTDYTGYRSLSYFAIEFDPKDLLTHNLIGVWHIKPFTEKQGL